LVVFNAYNANGRRSLVIQQNNRSGVKPNENKHGGDSSEVQDFPKVEGMYGYSIV
jgi:hypothetical protein